MKNCDRFENSIQSLIAGDPELEQLEELIAHCKICRDCRELFEMHRNLARLGTKFNDMESTELSEVRASIVEKVAEKNRQRPQRGWLVAFRTPLIIRPLPATAFIAAIFILGMVAFHGVDRSADIAGGAANDAFINASLKDVENSSYTYSNVALKYLDENRVSLEFDITKRIGIVEPASSKLVKGILMNSQANPSATGVVGHFQTKSVQGKYLY
jgi:hypothetical protein